MNETITLDIGALFENSNALIQDIPDYIRKAKRFARAGNDIVLTGKGPVWLYLIIAHELHGVTRSLIYDSPVSGRVMIFNHNPFTEVKL